MRGDDRRFRHLAADRASVRFRLLLIDERKGRRLAVQEHVPVIGLLGVVLLAKRRALTRSARALLQRLERDAGIYISEHIRDQALKSVGE